MEMTIQEIENIDRVFSLEAENPSQNEMLVQKLDERAILPTKAHLSDAGYDLYSIDTVVFKPGQVTNISTGIAVAIPAGHVGLIWDRSSMGAKGIKVMGGVIDSGYRGELKLKMVLLSTFEREWLTFPAGSKMAQLLIQRVSNSFIPKEVSQLPTSSRGDKGFGSSGI